MNQGCCAEMIAIGSALAAGEKSLDCIVAIDMDGRIVNPCGKCRQFIFDCSSSCDVLVEDNIKYIGKILLNFCHMRLIRRKLI